MVNHTINATPPERLQQCTRDSCWVQTVIFVLNWWKVSSSHSTNNNSREAVVLKSTGKATSVTTDKVAFSIHWLDFRNRNARTKDFWWSCVGRFHNNCFHCQWSSAKTVVCHCARFSSFRILIYDLLSTKHSLQLIKQRCQFCEIWSSCLQTYLFQKRGVVFQRFNFEEVFFRATFMLSSPTCLAFGERFHRFTSKSFMPPWLWPSR